MSHFPTVHLDFVELREWTAARLSAFKVPRFWQAVDALPRTATSRLAKHRLPKGHPPGEFDAEHDATDDGSSDQETTAKDRP